MTGDFSAVPGDGRVGSAFWPVPIDIRACRFAALLAAILIYACFSSPTPDGFGFPELATGGLLALAVGPAGALAALWPRAGEAFWRKAGRWLLVYGLAVPVLNGLAAGHDFGLMIRDVVPFLFLLLPLFIEPLLSADASFRLPVTVAVAGAGLMFALRLLVPSFIAHGRVGFSALPDADPLYLANAPTVLFMAILGFGLSGQLMMEARGRLYPWLKAGGFALASMGCVVAMAAVEQRATVGLMAVALVCLWGIAFLRRPLRALIPFAAMLLVFLVFYEQLDWLARNLLLKTELVGFNNRPEEAAVVFRAVGRSIGSSLFGLGWGQTIADPAVGDVTVNYTHTMVTALWLKTGFAGAFLGLCYLGGIAARLWSLLWRKPVLCAALAAPMLIDVSLYASYKSLDFGLILMLIPLWAEPRSKLRTRPPVLYSGMAI
jgi:hypothetical protein